MSRIFGVTTDYLLKDEQLPDESIVSEAAPAQSIRRVSMSEAAEFMELKRLVTPRIAAAVYMCIISPILLIALLSASDTGVIDISEYTALGSGLAALLLLVAGATAIFLSCSFKLKSFEYLENEPIETEYGVSGMVKEYLRSFMPKHNLYCTLGTVICILCVLPLFITFWGMNQSSSYEFIVSLATCLLLAIVGIGVIFFIMAGVPKDAADMLLQEGDYTIQNKKLNSFASIYWLLTVAVYLAYSFITYNWHISWIIWPISGVLFPVYMLIIKAFKR